MLIEKENVQLYATDYLIVDKNEKENEKLMYSYTRPTVRNLTANEKGKLYATYKLIFHKNEDENET